jgi:Tfp pilus assembly protein PilV
MIKVLNIETNQAGYTLMETVVAMALFVAVLIPLAGIIGNMLLDKTPEYQSTALQLAETEISNAIHTSDFSDISKKTDNGYLVERKCTKVNGSVTINIEVARQSKPQNKLITLEKTVRISE